HPRCRWCERIDLAGNHLRRARALGQHVCVRSPVAIADAPRPHAISFARLDHRTPPRGSGAPVWHGFTAARTCGTTLGWAGLESHQDSQGEWQFACVAPKAHACPPQRVAPDLPTTVRTPRLAYDGRVGPSRALVERCLDHDEN